MEHRRVARVFGMMQEVRLSHQLEPGRLDLLAQRAFLDAMKRLRDVDAVARPRRMGSIARKPPGFSAANIFLFIAARSAGV